MTSTPPRACADLKLLITAVATVIGDWPPASYYNPLTELHIPFLGARRTVAKPGDAPRPVCARASGPLVRRLGARECLAVAGGKAGSRRTLISRIDTKSWCKDSKS